MNGKKVAIAALGFPVLLVIVVLTLVLGGGGAIEEEVHQEFKGHVLGQTDLAEGAVPGWAVAPLLAAATTCPEITAPLLAAQIEAESNWNPEAHNDGSGADGLSQFLPSTWQAYGTDGDVPPDGKANPRDPEDAIKSQAVYMCYLVTFVKDTKGLTGEIVDLALASYNAGPGNVKRHGGIPPFQETTDYVAKIRRLANTKYADVGSPSTDVSGRAAQIIQKAAEHVDKTTYAWGGGTLNGPSAGSSPDVGVVGFDCSSLVRYAYYQGSGQAITLPRTSREQYAATRSQPVAENELQPGDLLFWGKGRIHHVALYVGKDKTTGKHRMIEAWQSGTKLRITDIRTGGDYAGAGRVFGGPLDRSSARA